MTPPGSGSSFSMSGKRSCELLVVGSANMDLVANVSLAPAAGETVLCDTYFRAPGGKGANQAVAAARMGAAVRFVACLGNDGFGQELKAVYEADGIEIHQIALRDHVATGAAFIWVEPSGENRIVVASGANATLSIDQVDQAFSELERGGSLPRVLLTQLESPVPAVARALERAHALGISTILNPAPAMSLPPNLLGCVDILCPNQGEAAKLASLPESCSPEELAMALLDSGVGAVCMTLGKDGALLVQKGRSPRSFPARPVQVVDTTAAGDTFCGALATELAHGAALEDAVPFSVVAASLACTAAGAQPSIPTRAAIEQFLLRS